MEFDTDWLTLGRHRIRLRSTKGFPTETMRTVTEVVRLAIDNNMSAGATRRGRLPARKDLRRAGRHDDGGGQGLCTAT